MSPPKALTCHKCSRGYISKDLQRQRCPVLLECGHSTCEECVRSVASKEPLLACPQCQQLSCVNVAELQHDAYLNGCLVLKIKPAFNPDTLGFVTQKKARKNSDKTKPLPVPAPQLIPDKEKCEECCMKRGTLLCAKCEDIRFCDTCFSKVHCTTKTLSRHVARPAPVATSGSDSGATATVQRSCHLHQGRPLEYFCVDDSVAVCSHCSISGQHKGHTVEPVSDRNARRRAELEQAVERTRNTFMRLRMAAKSLRGAPAVDELDPAGLLETIQQHFAQLHGQLQLRQRQLSNQLLTAAQAQRAHVAQLGCTVDESLETVRRLLAEAEGGLAGTDATLDLDDMLQRLAQTADRPCHLVWASADQRQCEAKFLADKTLLTSIGEHGQLELTAPPPVQLLSESELPLDHVVKDITPEMLAEADAASLASESVSSDGASRPGNATGSGSVEVVGVARGGTPRLLTSPRPPDSRLAAVFPGQSRPSATSTPQGRHPQPPLPSLPRLMDDPPARRVVAYPKQPVELGPYGQELVLVTHINRPSNFYVQRSDKQRAVQDLMRRIQSCKKATNAEGAQQAVTCTKNEPCLCQYAKDGLWYRARIIDIYPPSEEGAQAEYEVFYVDFGNQERVYRSRLRPLTRALAQQPEMSLPCALWDLVPAGGAVWSPQAIQTFAELVRGEPIMMTTIREVNGRREVELLKPASKSITSDSPQSVKDHLVFLGLAKFIAGPSKRPEPAVVPSRGVSTNTVSVEHMSAGDTRRFYASEQLQRGQNANVLVSHVESPHLFYVQQLGVHADYLSAMMDEMQKVYGSSRATGLAMLNPRKGQVCAACFTADGKYYRAVIEAILHQAIVDVVYVDFGNRERVPLSAVRKIEDKFMVIPQQAIVCRLADIQPSDPQAGWEDEVRRRFIEAAEDSVLKMYVESVSATGEHTVALYKCRPDVDICINALLAQMDAVYGTAPSLRVVEYKKVGYEPTREVRSAVASSTGSGSSARRPLLPEPALPESPKSRTTGTSAPSDDVGESGSGPVQVVVSHCQSPAVFFVQISGEMAILNTMMRDMQIDYGAGGVGASRAGYTWKPGDVAVARCAPDNLFYRVRVTEQQQKDGNKIQVYLIDYGKTEAVDQTDVVTLLPKFEEHRAFAMRCHLHGIRPAGDSGAWTGFAIDFLKTMLIKSKVLFLISRCSPAAPAGDVSSLPCDLEVEEEKVVGALEPIRRIRTSLAGKLVEQGLAFNDARSCLPAATTSVGEPAWPRAAVLVERPASPSSYMDTALPSVHCWADDVEDALTLCPDDDDSPDETAQEAAEAEQEIPLGGDWATLSGRGRQRAGTPPTAVSASAAEIGDLERTMLEQEEAAEAVEDQQLPDDDWLPARVPMETRFQAVPTHVTMAGSIYLHMFPKGKETLDIIQQALLSKYRDSQPRPCDAYWHEGQPCIARYFLDKNWYRAKVLQVHTEKVSVQFIDYGNTDRVEPSDLRKNVFMEHVPIQSLHCELYNIAPLAEEGCFPVKTLNFLHQQIVERQCDVEVHHFNAARRRFLISLKLVHSGMDINELLVNMGDARYMTDAELAAAAGCAEPLVDTLLLRAPFARLRLPSAAPPVPVLCVAALSPSLVLVQPQTVIGEPLPQLRRLAEQLDTIEAVRQKLEELAETQPKLDTVVVGAPCLCRFSADQLWYRAVVLSVDADSARVQYVDWGNTEQVSVSSLRAVPADLLEVPAWTLLVELYRIAPPDASGWKPDAKTTVEQCLFNPDVQLWAKVKQSQREPPLVELVVYDDLQSPNPKPRLAYQKAIDDGLVTLCTTRRRQ